jgi:hypothetical protein
MKYNYDARRSHTLSQRQCTVFFQVSALPLQVNPGTDHNWSFITQPSKLKLRQPFLRCFNGPSLCLEADFTNGFYNLPYSPDYWFCDQKIVVRLLAWERNVLFSKAPRSPQPPIQTVPSALSLRIRRAEREVENLPPFSADVINAWSLHEVVLN